MPDFTAMQGIPHDSCTVSAATSSGGLALTAGGTANTMSAWSQMIAATLLPVSWAIISIRCGTTTAAQQLIDIGIGASTAEKVLFPTLFADMRVTGEQSARIYVIPCTIPAGSRLSARAQSSAASEIVLLGLTLIAGGMLDASFLGITEGAGMSTATGSLTQIDPGGTAHTDGSWVQLIAATSFPYRWLNIAFGHSASVTGAAQDVLMDIGIGAAAAEKVLVPDLYVHNNTTVDCPHATFQMPVSVPAGSRLSARCRSSITTATTRILDVAVWGSG